MRGLGQSAGWGKCCLIIAMLTVLVPLPSSSSAATASSISMTVRQLSGTEADVEVTKAVLEVSLSAPSSSPISINYETLAYSLSHICPAQWPTYCAEAGEDYIDSAGVLIFAPGETAQTLTVPIVPDDWAERGLEYLGLGLYQASTRPDEPEVSATRTAVSIQDDDPALSMNYPSILEGDSGTRSVTLKIFSQVVPKEPITVNYKTRDGAPYIPSLLATGGSDYVRASGVVELLPGEREKSIQVKIRGDKKAEGNGRRGSGELFGVVLSDAKNAALWDDETLVYIKDNDFGSTVTKANDDDRINLPSRVTLSPSSSTGEAPGSHTITATVRDRLGSPVAVADVHFSVTGANPASSQIRTGKTGTAILTYSGQRPGDDTISAFADINEDDVRQAGEPIASARHSWALFRPRI